MEKRSILFVLFTTTFFLLNAQFAPNPFNSAIAENSFKEPKENFKPYFSKNQPKPQNQTDFSFLNVTPKIAVISDTHIMSKELLVKDGEAYQSYLRKDRKLLQESEAIAQETVERLLEENPDLVLICGDVSKDGELLSHLEFKKIFTPLLKKGIKVLVIPGNHDILNPHSVYFCGDSVKPAETISPEKFKEIYADFGYKDAISYDTNSLSYFSEPLEGLCVVSIDACKYYDNTFKNAGAKSDSCVTNGKIKPETMQWLTALSQKAVAEGKQVIAMVHHNVVEHFDYQGSIAIPYLVDNFKQTQKDLMNAGIQIVFTGHFHISDIVKTYGDNGSYLYDVVTGSTVTYPCPYRIIQNRNHNVLSIETKFIDKINYPTHGIPFPEYAKSTLQENIPFALKSIVREYYPSIQSFSKKYSAYIKMPNSEKLQNITADYFGKIIAEAFVAMGEGNEQLKDNEETLRLFDKNIEKMSRQLSTNFFVRWRIASAVKKMEIIKKLQFAMKSIFYNSKTEVQQGNNTNTINDLNYSVILQSPQTLALKKASFFSSNQAEKK